eukprot:101937-Prymnesium_polylepis.1
MPLQIGFLRILYEATDTQRATIENFSKADVALAYERPAKEFKRAVGQKYPTMTESDVSKTYRMTRDGFKSIVHDTVLAAIEPFVPEAISEMNGNFAVVPENQNTTDIEARMAVVWYPMGEIGECISKTAALQHASARCKGLMKKYEAEVAVESFAPRTATYALMV